jgi:hypothetical protein
LWLTGGFPRWVPPGGFPGGSPIRDPHGGIHRDGFPMLVDQGKPEGVYPGGSPSGEHKGVPKGLYPRGVAQVDVPRGGSP